MNNKLVGTHSFNFNQRDNGGESLTLITKMFSNGDEGVKGIFLNQELTLQSYCNSATFGLVGTVLTPEILRDLANQLESALIKAGNENKKPETVARSGNVATSQLVCRSCGK